MTEPRQNSPYGKAPRIKPHLLVDISAHGFGHLAQTATVLAALHEQFAGFSLTIRTAHEQPIIEKFVQRPFEIAPPPPDIGLEMLGPSDVDCEQSMQRYRKLHQNISRVIKTESARLSALAPSIILSNIPYTTLLAAKASGIRALALCSLNWFDIFKAYLADTPQGVTISDQIKHAYQAADIFIKPTPSMAMDWHHQTMNVDPIARIAADLPRPKALPIARGQGGPALVLAGLGGIKSNNAPLSLPAMPNIHWLTNIDHPARQDVTSLAASGLSFLDAIPFADVVLTKSGYGTFTECAANGARVLFAARPDWPEASALEPWLLKNTTADAISQSQLFSGNYAPQLERLLARPKTPASAANGAAQAAAIILPYLLRP